MSNSAVQAPIVLVHGILGFDRLPLVGAYFRGIREALVADGNVVPEPPQLNTAGSIEERTDNLEDYLNSPANPGVFGKQVHLIAHSMGGLDARHLISRNNFAFSQRVLSLTTIGTPHGGTPFADVGDARFEYVIDALLATGVDVRGFRDLTVAAAVDFNANHPDAIAPLAKNTVSYFSIAGQFAPGWADILRIPHEIIVGAEAGENDGLVPVASARHGEFLGIWQADHFRLVNQGTNLILTPQERADSSIVNGYRAIVQRLVDAGF